MSDFRIRRNGAVAVLVDTQEKLFPHIHEHDVLEGNLIRLMKGLKLLEVPIVVTQQYTRGLGPTIPSMLAELNERSHDTIHEKMHFSCCGSKEFNKAIAEAGTVILFGIEAHVCVLQTALDLLAATGARRAKRVAWVDDCIGSRKPNDKRIAYDRARLAGALPTTYESLLLELCEVSGTDTFKAISKLIK